MPGSWQPLNNPATFNLDAMLLLTDGSVMCHEYVTPNWHKLTPDKDSDYANGTWHTLSPMPNNAPAFQNGPADAPLYFASAVLRDGTVFCAGGEDNGAYNGDDLLTAELYDPVADVWTPIATPPGWTHIGDGSSCVLPDGRVLLGNANTNAFPNATAIWDPESGTWSDGGNSSTRIRKKGGRCFPTARFWRYNAPVSPTRRNTSSPPICGSAPAARPFRCPRPRPVPWRRWALRCYCRMDAYSPLAPMATPRSTHRQSCRPIPGPGDLAQTFRQVAAH
jgi:Kelch motif